MLHQTAFIVINVDQLALERDKMLDDAAHFSHDVKFNIASDLVED